MEAGFVARVTRRASGATSMARCPWIDGRACASGALILSDQGGRLMAVLNVFELRLGREECC